MMVELLSDTGKFILPLRYQFSFATEPLLVFSNGNHIVQSTACFAISIHIVPLRNPTRLDCKHMTLVLHY
jgi:hypothetical protein